MKHYDFIPKEFRPFDFGETDMCDSTHTRTLKVQRDCDGRIVLQKELEYDQYPDENSKLMAFLEANGVVSKDEARKGRYRVVETDEQGVFIVYVETAAITIKG